MDSGSESDDEEKQPEKQVDKWMAYPKRNITLGDLEAVSLLTGRSKLAVKHAGGGPGAEDARIEDYESDKASQIWGTYAH